MKRDHFACESWLFQKVSNHKLCQNVNFKNEGTTIQMGIFAFRIPLTAFIVHGSLGPRLFCLFFSESYQIDKASTRKGFIQSFSKDALAGQHQTRIKGVGAGGQMSSLQLH